MESLSRAFASRFDAVARPVPPPSAPPAPQAQPEGWRNLLCMMLPVTCPCGGPS